MRLAQEGMGLTENNGLSERASLATVSFGEDGVEAGPWGGGIGFIPALTSRATRGTDKGYTRADKSAGELTADAIHPAFHKASHVRATSPRAGSRHLFLWPWL